MAGCSKSFQLSKNLKPDGHADTPLGEWIFKNLTPQPVYVKPPSTMSIAMPPASSNNFRSIAPSAAGIRSPIVHHFDHSSGTCGCVWYGHRCT